MRGMIYVISYGGYDNPDEHQQFKTEEEFLKNFNVWNRNERSKIRLIIKGSSFKVIEKKKEVVTEIGIGIIIKWALVEND